MELTQIGDTVGDLRRCLGARPLVQLDDRQVLHRLALIDGKIKRQLQVIGFRIVEGDSMASAFLSTTDLPLRCLIHTLTKSERSSAQKSLELQQCDLLCKCRIATPGSLNTTANLELCMQARPTISTAHFISDCTRPRAI